MKNKRKMPLKELEELELAIEYLNKFIKPQSDGNGIHIALPAEERDCEFKIRNQSKGFMESWVIGRLNRVLLWAEGEK